MSVSIPNDPPLVSVLILSYGRPDRLRQCLESLSDQTYSPLELWVIDNRSPESDEITRLVSAHARARLVSIFRNRGYTGGMNVGLDVATGKYVLFVHDDVVVEPAAIAAFVEYAGRYPEAGLLGGVILNKETGTIRSAGGALHLGPTFEKRVLGAGEPDRGRFTTPYLAGFVPGAMLFAETALMTRLGGFRRDFFFSDEDVELCLRLRRMGRPVVVVPGARAAHFDPPLNPGPPVLEFHRQKNFLSLYLLHARLPALWRALWRYGVAALWRPRGNRWIALRARLWVLRNSPRLFLDRLQNHLERRPE